MTHEHRDQAASSRLRRYHRREVLRAAAGAGAALTLGGCASPFPYDDGGMTDPAAILNAGYDDRLADVIEQGFTLIAPPDVRDKRVVLKVNLVDLPREGRPAVTDPAVILAAAEAFRRRGAAEVIVADGPALQRDAWQIVDAIGLTTLLGEQRIPFIDLNTAAITRQPNPGAATGLSDLYFAAPAFFADVLVSMPKMKTHHWAGASLAMKNMFGTLSGQIYGMPRNRFHLRNLHAAVLDFNRVRAPDYCIVDGITAMEGDGPIRGSAIDVGVVVMGRNGPAVDATCARIMDIRPEAVEYLRRAAGQLGPIAEASIEQRGEPITAVQHPFELLSHQFALTV